MDFQMRLNTSEGVFTFTFTLFYTIRGEVYFVRVSSPDDFHLFYMEQKQGTWKIAAHKEPRTWIYKYEDELANVIKENKSKPQFV